MKRTHERFIEIVACTADPATNNPGDEVFHEMFTKVVRSKDDLTEGYLFYHNVAGEANKYQRTLVDQESKIWTTNIKKVQVSRRFCCRCKEGLDKEERRGSNHRNIPNKNRI